MGFFSSLFKSSSSNKEEKDSNEEYIEYLLKELGKVKDEKDAVLKQEHSKVEELQKSIEQAQNEKMKLEEQISALMTREPEPEIVDNDANAQEIQKLQEQLKTYETTYSDLAKYMALAKNDAEKAREMAKQDADDILLKAKQDAQTYQIDAEAAIKEKERQSELKFEIARYKVKEYLNAVNKVQSALIENYNDLGNLIKQMPLRIDDIFSDEPFELLVEHEKKEPDEPVSMVDDDDDESVE